MLYTIFDLETTGFNGTSDAVCQFAFITVNQNLLPVRARNYYFYKEGMPWSEQAAAVHGLTRSFLKQYEDEYEQNLIRMYTVLQRGNLVGHNSNGFDIPFANQFLMRDEDYENINTLLLSRECAMTLCSCGIVPLVSV